MYGTTWCQDCKRAKKFLGEHRIPYDFIDIDQDKGGLQLVEQINAGKRIIPTIFFGDGSVLVEPSNAELAAKLGLQTRPDCLFYDLVIVGGGPTGLTAALYAAREGIDTLVVERGGFGGQAGVTERLDNYPGFPEGISGGEFADRLVAQDRRFGVELLTGEVTSVHSAGQYRVLRLANGDEVRSYAVLLAPGSTYRRLGVPGEDALIGAGIHFCATCDGPLYRGQEMLLVGGGNSATEEAIFLTKFASRLTLVTRDPHLTASKTAQDDVLAHPQISVRYRTTVKEFRGTSKLTGVVLRDLDSGAEEEVHPAAVFLFVGLQPNTGFLQGVVELSDGGFIVTGPTLETSLRGVFAAGDARAGSTKQLVSAAGEGATAALMIRQLLQAAREARPAAEALERDAAAMAARTSDQSRDKPARRD
jgi:thioredoxin reductase (NADPH)